MGNLELNFETREFRFKTSQFFVPEAPNTVTIYLTAMTEIHESHFGRLLSGIGRVI
jgi:hypothetical protein